MRVSAIEVTEQGATCQLQARVASEAGLFEPFLLWYRYPAWCRPYVSAENGDPFLAALLTGAMWGKPTWGAWWVWDARLTSELILLFQYAGVMLLRTSIDDMRRADRSSAVFALVGVVNVPIIYYSVQWWNTLHQGASVSMSTGSKMAATMLMAMLIMTIAFWLYSIAVILARVRCIVVERDSLPVWDEKPAVIQEAVEAR